MSDKVTFSPATGFYPELKSRVDDYFIRKGLRKNDNWQMYLKTGLIVVWLLASYVTIVFFSESYLSAVPLVISLAMAFSAVGFNIQHDGGHEAYSKSKIVNWLMAFTLDLIGGSSVFWRQKHNILHHTYTNVNGMDEDIYDGSMFRLSPAQPLKRIHKFQHYYTYALYAFLTLKWIFYDDWKQLIAIKRGKIKSPKVSAVQASLFVSTKAIHLFYTIVLPLFFHTFLNVILLNILFHFILGFTLSIVFQMAHAVPEASFPVPADDGRLENDWAVHQVLTTADFARGNPVVSWFVGGLNYQIEHHLFPRISHVHYHKLSPIVEETCRDFGIKYTAYRGFFSGFRAHFLWLRQMGRLPA